VQLFVMCHASNIVLEGYTMFGILKQGIWLCTYLISHVNMTTSCYGKDCAWRIYNVWFFEVRYLIVHVSHKVFKLSKICITFCYDEDCPWSVYDVLCLEAMHAIVHIFIMCHSSNIVLERHTMFGFLRQGIRLCRYLKEDGTTFCYGEDCA
jgi:hypothetical protein